MAYPVGANSDLYNALTRQLGHPPTVDEYNAGVRWVNVQGGTNLPEFPTGAGGTATTTPPSWATGYNPESGWNMTPGQTPTYTGTATTGGGPALTPAVTTGAGGEGAAVINPSLYTFEQQLALQQAADNAAMARAQLSAQTTQATSAAQLAAQQAMAQAELQAALERLRYQVAGDLTTALMQNDINRANLTMDVAKLAADPRSAVGFLEYLGHQGGGPTAMSQGLVAGMKPSPVWEYMPETQGLSPEVQELIDTLKGFVGGGR